MLQLVRNGQYLRFWMAQIATELGDGLIRTVLIYLISTLTQSAVMIGFIIFAQMLPTALFGVFIGGLPDRFSKRWLLVYSNVLQLFTVVGMWFFRDNAWMLLALMVLYGFGMALYEPTRSAAIPGIVGRDHIPKAVALSQGTHQALAIIGPSIAGLLFLINNFSLIFALIMVTYVMAIILLYFFRASDQEEKKPEDNEESYIASIRSGIKHVYSMPALRFLLVLLIPITLSAGVLNTNINTLFLQTFQVPAEQYGFLQAFVGGGAVVGALTAPNILKRLRPGYMMVGSVGMLGILMISVLFVSFLVQQSGLSSVYVWSLFIGVFNASLNVPLSALFLQTTPSSFLGRGAALMQANVNLGTMAGILIGGWMAGVMSSSYVLALVGMFLVSVMIVFPFLKGFKLLNQIPKPELSEVTQTIEGVIGHGIMIRKKLTDPDLLHTLFQKRYHRILAMLAAAPLTTRQLAGQLGEPHEDVRADIHTLEENQFVKRVEGGEEKADSDILYTFNREHAVQYDVDHKLASEHKSLVMEGVSHIFQSGCSLLEKGLESENEKPLYHMMLSTSTDRMTADRWRQLHQRMMQLRREMEAEDGSNDANDSEEDTLFPLTTEETEKEGTYVFMLMSYRLEDVEAVNLIQSKEMQGESGSTIHKTGDEKELGT